MVWIDGDSLDTGNSYLPPPVEGHEVKNCARNLSEYILTSLVTGVFVGSLLTLLLSFIFIGPPWLQLMKGDERWETVFLFADTVLPLVIVFCILGTTVFLKIRVSFRLRHREMTICLFVAALIVAGFRPVVARVYRTNNVPYYESVPDTIFQVIVAMMVVTIGSGLWGLRRSNEKSPNGL